SQDGRAGSRDDGAPGRTFTTGQAGEGAVRGGQSRGDGRREAVATGERKGKPGSNKHNAKPKPSSHDSAMYQLRDIGGGDSTWRQWECVGQVRCQIVRALSLRERPSFSAGYWGAHCQRV
ncbi:hypothetical protein FIBSPDRAFT_866273, partial [Athelia psychrophila]